MGLARGLLIATLLFALAGVILIAIALGTDSWKCFTVDRNALNQNVAVDKDIDNDQIYFSRNYGFFRQCFPDDIPQNTVFNQGVDQTEDEQVELSKSPHGTQCTHFFPGFRKRDGMSSPTKEVVDMKIAYITLYAIGLFIAVLALLFMLIGIGLKKGIPVIFTGFSFFIAAIFLAAAIGVWHKTNDELKMVTNFSPNNDNSVSMFRNRYSSEVWDSIHSNNPVVGEGGIVKNNTVENFCWSYYIAWIGIGLIFLTAIISCCLTVIIAQERKASRDKRYQEMYGVSGMGMQMPNLPIGGGQSQVYATGTSEKAMVQYPMDGGAYSNYGYAGPQYGMQPGYASGVAYGDYMGYYNPFATMGR